MDQVIIDHSTKMFTAAEVTTPPVTLTELHDRVTTEMNSDLSKTYTMEEVKEALHQMAPLKALSPYSMGCMAPIFFQHF